MNSTPRRLATAAALAVSVSALPVLGLAAPADASSAFVPGPDCWTEQTRVSSPFGNVTTPYQDQKAVYDKAANDATTARNAYNDQLAIVKADQVELKRLRSTYASARTPENRTAITTQEGVRTSSQGVLAQKKTALQNAVALRKTEFGRLSPLKTALSTATIALRNCLKRPPVLIDALDPEVTENGTWVAYGLASASGLHPDRDYLMFSTETYRDVPEEDASLERSIARRRVGDDGTLSGYVYIPEQVCGGQLTSLTYTLARFTDFGLKVIAQREMALPC